MSAAINLNALAPPALATGAGAGDTPSPWRAGLTGHLAGWERVALATVGALLFLTLVLPIWRVYLWSGQYPEGLRILIWARDLTGDVQNVNILNHYIGMKPLSIEAFPEFVWMGPAMAGLGGLLLLAALVGRREGMVLAALAVIGFDLYMLYDLYFWMYDWGHQLSPRAPMKVAPFTPPVLGFKHIANFYVISHPSWGGVLVMLATFIGPLLICVSLYRSWQRQRSA